MYVVAISTLLYYYQQVLIVNPPNLIVNNNTIDWNLRDMSVKYLGVHLDQGRATFSTRGLLRKIL